MLNLRKRMSTITSVQTVKIGLIAVYNTKGHNLCNYDTVSHVDHTALDSCEVILIQNSPPLCEF